jgi:hypothetical protein
MTLLSPTAVPGQTLPPQPGKAAPAIGCPSLANLRILLRRSSEDPAAAAASLADEKADHLGCMVLGKDKVTAIVDRAAFDGSAYDCASLQGTSVCHWTLAGTVTPAAPAPPRELPREKGRR